MLILTSILLKFFYCPNFTDDGTDGWRVNNLLKVKQLITGYISLAVYEKCPKVTEELTSAYMLGILGKASHGPTCSHVHTCACVCACVCVCMRVVTHSPTRTLRIEGGILALRRD